MSHGGCGSVAAMGPPWLAIIAACLLGVPAGIGGFTFVYAKGFSYLSTDPRACVNCHIMTLGAG